MDYAVPWDDFGKYGLIILSRDWREYLTFFRDRDGNPPNKGQARWLTPAQEQKFEDYVNAGRRLFSYHDGFSYPKGNTISRIARAYFVQHPAVFEIKVTTLPNTAAPLRGGHTPMARGRWPSSFQATALQPSVIP